MDPLTIPADDARKNLFDLIRTRIVAAREKSVSDWRKWYAMDRAYDVPFNQITPTMLSGIEQKDSKGPVNQTIKAQFDLLNEKTFNKIKVQDPKSGKDIEKTEVDIPTFFQVFVPIARAYLTMRHGKLMGDFDQTPFLKYEPALSTAKSRMQCQAVTNRIERQGADMGYRDTWKQFTFNYLHYGISMAFPREEWYWDEHEQEDGTMRIDREGLRYHVPHPCRVDYDLSYPISTLNSDTGCSYALYWKAVKFGEIRRNKAWWNSDKVSLGSTDWWTNAGMFFNTMYGTAAIRFPIDWRPSNTDRETAFADRMMFYGPEQDEKPCLQTELFQKLIPSEYGLGDYDKPVWFRFVVASEYSVLYAAPLAYCPVWTAPYDADENRSDTASMTMELIPFQDHFTQLMSQYILAVKQNLVNITFVDTDMFAATEKKDDSWFERLKRMGTEIYSKINFLPISGAKWKKAMIGQNGAPSVFQQFKFPNMNTVELLNAMQSILQVTERMMGISSQEVGQSASHELRVDEVRAINSSANVRVAATMRPLTRAMMAWMKQLYDALMCYGSEDMWAQIPFEASIDKSMLQQFGFDWDEAKNPSTPSDNTIVVNFRKSAVSLLEFASSRPQDQRSNNAAAAAQMLAALSQALAVPIVLQTIGRQVIPLLNQVFQMAGFPSDFKLDDHGDLPQVLTDEQQQQIVQMLQQAEQQIMKQVQEGVTPIAEAVKEISGAVNQLSEAAKQTVEDQKSMAEEHKAMEDQQNQLVQAVEHIGEVLKHAEAA